MKPIIFESTSGSSVLKSISFSIASRICQPLNYKQVSESYLEWSGAALLEVTRSCTDDAFVHVPRTVAAFDLEVAEIARLDEAVGVRAMLFRRSELTEFDKVSSAVGEDTWILLLAIGFCGVEGICVGSLRLQQAEGVDGEMSDTRTERKKMSDG